MDLDHFRFTCSICGFQLNFLSVGTAKYNKFMVMCLIWISFKFG